VPERSVEGGLPERRIDKEQQGRRPSHPQGEHTPAESDDHRQAKSAGYNGEDEKRSFGVAQKEIKQAGDRDEQWVPRRLRLMNAGIKVFQGKREVDVIDGQILRGGRNARQQQQGENDDPENAVFFLHEFKCRYCAPFMIS
jgi:hypothetical protein